MAPVRGSRGPWSRALILAALGAEAMGDAAAMREALEAALLASRTESSTAVFAEEGEPVRGLLGALIEDERASPILRRIAEPIYRSFASTLREKNALSEREAEVFAHLADGASNKLIARRLGLTEDTIKYHLKKNWVNWAFPVAVRRRRLHGYPR